MVSPLMQGLLAQLLQPVQPDQLMLRLVWGLGRVTDSDLLSEEEEVGGHAGLVVAVPQFIW